MAGKIVAIVGARPNYMKVAPIWRSLDKNSSLDKKLVHTGQHYDDNMSKIFFDELKLPKPDVFLGVGSASHAQQTAKIMVELESILTAERPDLLVVVGDVNSTMAGALVAAKLGVPVAHVEAGLRSFDRGMPEEINRIVTDTLSDLLFTTEASAEKNLVREGVDPAKIHFVGNVMIDSLQFYRPMAEQSAILDDVGVEPAKYSVATLHRPSNVDDPESLRGLLDVLVQLAADYPIVFPVHPRTRKIINDSKIDLPADKIRVLDPIGYLDFAKLLIHARLVLTDSGGIQEETTVLGVPCLTIRENTERPITLEIGTNRLVGVDPGRILQEGRQALKQGPGGGQIPELWDGNAADRIVQIVDNFCK